MCQTALINTYSGKIIDLLNPRVEDIVLEDIARGLAFKSHFIGQTPYYFSIAEHSILVADLTGTMESLMHDASEAYLSDIAKPLKAALPEYKKIEIRLMKVICERFDLDFSKMEEEKYADVQILGSEFEMFFGNTGINNPFTTDKDLLTFKKKDIFIGYNPEQAYKEFLKKYYIIKSLKK